MELETKFEYPRCVTNFSKDQLPRYQKAIEGWDELYISDQAIDRLGRALKDTFALMLRENKDLSGFWKKLRDVPIPQQD